MKTKQLLILLFGLLPFGMLMAQDLSYPQIDSVFTQADQNGVSPQTLEIARYAAQKAQNEFGLTDSMYLNYAIQLIYYLSVQREYDAVEDLSQKLLNLKTGMSTSNLKNHYLQLYREMVAMYKSMGRKEEMFDSHEQLLQLSKKVLGGEHPEHLSEMTNGAMMYMGARQFGKAERMFKRILDIQGKLTGKTDLDYAHTLHLLAQVYDGTHQEDRGLELNLQVLDIIKKTIGTNSRPYRVMLGNLSGGYSSQGNFEKAEALQLESLKLTAGSGQKQSAGYALSLRNLGILYITMERYEAAEKRLKESLELYELLYGKHSPKLVINYINLADLYRRLKQFDKAVDCIQQSFFVNSTNMDSLDLVQKEIAALVFDFNYADVYLVSTSLSMLDKVYDSQYAASKELDVLKKRHETLQLFAKYVEKMTTSFQTDGDMLWQVFISNKEYLKGIQVANKLHELTNEQVWIEDAFFYFESNKAALLANAMKNNTAHQFGNIPDSLAKKERDLRKMTTLLQKRIEEAQAQRNGPAVIKIREEQIQNNLEVNQLTRFLETNFQSYYQYKYGSGIIDIPTAKAAIPNAKTMVLEYYIWKELVFVLALTKENSYLKKLPIKASVLTTQISDLRAVLGNYKAIAKSKGSVDTTFVRLASACYENLLKPILDSVTGIEHLIIVPDNLLGQVPFEVFLKGAVDSKDSDYRTLPYLVNDYALTYSYSMGLLTENNRSVAAPQYKGILGFTGAYDWKPNNPAKRSQRHKKIRKYLKPLPAAQEELKVLETEFAGQFFYNEQAGEHQFKAIAEDYSIIHLAMHGMTNENFPLFSSLAFTEIGDSLEDNFLEAYEISHLELNAELVVLSACETGVGKFEQGEGVMSLARSFMYAGVPSLVVSLWQVNDHSTSIVIQAFYENLAQGMDKAQALRQAKLEYLDNAVGLAAHPAFWSPFIQMGNARPVNLPKRGSWLWWGVGVGVLGLGFLVLKSRKR